jgi:predicted nuclease of predicted toxin-antitoxin system
VKLLFDENVSPRLTELLAAEYPESTHVRDVGLTGKPDEQIWDYARDNGLTIVSKDDDFRQRSFLKGAPPKIVWLQVGNAECDGQGRDAVAGKGRLTINFHHGCLLDGICDSTKNLRFDVRTKRRVEPSRIVCPP